MKKRLFELLDQMNVSDIENGSRLVEVSSNLISADKIKQGGQVSMGVPEQSIHDLMNDKKMPVLLMIDKEEYAKLTNKNS